MQVLDFRSPDAAAWARALSETQLAELKAVAEGSPTLVNDWALDHGGSESTGKYVVLVTVEEGDDD